MTVRHTRRLHPRRRVSGVRYEQLRGRLVDREVLAEWLEDRMLALRAAGKEWEEEAIIDLLDVLHDKCPRRRRIPDAPTDRASA